MKDNKLDALFFGAHPDDIEITCGGTVLKLVKSGKKVGIADLTRGELSTRGTLELRANETANASRILGVHTRYNLDMQDGNIVNTPESRMKIIEIIRIHKPEIVFAPYASDRHPDHINASNLIRECVFYAGLNKIITGDLGAYRPKRLFFFRHGYDIPVSFIFDISGEFETKMKAILAYKSQFYNEDNNGDEPETYISSKLFLKDLEARARFFGFKIGAEFGEPFHCIENLKVTEDTLFTI